MKKHKWTIAFTACLLAFTVFLAMDTFVLSSVYQTDAIEMNMNVFSQAEAGSNTSGKDQTSQEDEETGTTSKSEVTGATEETEETEESGETGGSSNPGSGTGGHRKKPGGSDRKSVV